jgi:hypothetical protein
VVTHDLGTLRDASLTTVRRDSSNGRSSVTAPLSGGSAPPSPHLDLSSGSRAKTEPSFGGYFQQRWYAYLIFTQPAFRSVERVTLREFYVRYSEPREITLSRDREFEDIREELATLVELFDRSVERNEWVPSPGQHCGSARTRFLTDQGVRTFGEACGEHVRVLNRHGEWEDAEVRSFGTQRLVRVTFDDGSVVRATPDHRWWTMRKNRRGQWSQTRARSACRPRGCSSRIHVRRRLDA